MTHAILQVRHLHKSFGGIRAVKDCSLDIKKGSITGLIGPNGAGKTTVFNLITGLLATDQGSILLDGEDITRWPTYKRAQKGLARTFQMIRIFPNLSVLENLKVAFPPAPEKELERQARVLLEEVQLEDKAHLLAGELSYGQQKILELIRTQALNPKLILLDEPTAGIHLNMRRQFIKLMYRMRDEGKTLLVIEHDMNFMMEICEKIIVLDFGSVIAEGSPKEVQKNPRVLEAYLGTHP